MSRKVQLPKNVYDAMKHLQNSFGIGFLFKYEYMIGHYKRSNKYAGHHLTSITEIVDFVKSSDDNRKKYFKALINGYEVELTPEDILYQKYSNPNKYRFHSFNEQEHYAYQEGILDTLELMKLKVKGINELINTK